MNSEITRDLFLVFFTATPRMPELFLAEALARPFSSPSAGRTTRAGLIAAFTLKRSHLWFRVGRLDMIGAAGALIYAKISCRKSSIWLIMIIDVCI